MSLITSISTGFPITGDAAAFDSSCPGGICFMGSALGSGPAAGPMSLSPSLTAADEAQSTTTEVSLRDLVRRSQDGVVVANFGICDDEWCEAVRPDFELAARRAGDVPFVTVAMQKAENARAIRKFNIRSYPHIAAFHRGKQVAVAANDRRSAQDFVAIARQGMLGGAHEGGAGAGAGASHRRRRGKYRDHGANYQAARKHFQKRKDDGAVMLVKTSVGCGYCTQLKKTLKQLIAEVQLACDVIVVEYDPSVSITEGDAAEAIPQAGVPVTYIHRGGRGIDADDGIIVGAHPAETYTRAVAAAFGMH